MARYCGIREEVLRNLLNEPRVLDGLLSALHVPGKMPQLKKLPDQEKRDAIARHAQRLVQEENSIWYGSNPLEVLAATTFGLGLPAKIVGKAFSEVRNEADLAPAVGAWFREHGHVPFAEVPLGNRCVDVLGHRKGSFLTSERLVAVELKNDLAQLTRGLDQMVTFNDYAHAVFLACTPALIAEYLHKHAKSRNVTRWEADLLYRRLKQLRFGLLIVEGDKVHLEINTDGGTADSSRMKEAVKAIASAKEIALLPPSS